MDKTVLDRFHNRLALFMSEIHRICVEHNIRYSMIGGTLLGALRHKGFIPWDDDIDIAMPYNDFMRFIEVMKNLRHDWIELDYPSTTSDFYNTYIKAYDKRTTFIEGDGQTPKGIFIDVFPIVCAGNTKVEALLNFKRFRFYDALFRRKGYQFNTGNIRERLLCILSSFYSRKYLLSKIQRLYTEYMRTPKTFSSDMNGTVKGIVRSDYWEKYCLYRFEDYEFYGVKEAHEYLTDVFGDYMKLPPIEKQVPHHVFYLNLDLPYSEYKYE